MTPSSNLLHSHGSPGMVIILMPARLGEGFDFMASQPTPPGHVTPPPTRNKGLIAGLIKGNQWLLGGAFEYE